MTGHLISGLAAALGAAALYGTAPIGQALAARTSAPGAGVGLALTLRLARRPIWLAALLADIVGFALEAYAFSQAPSTLVSPLMATDMLIFVLLGWPAFGERPSRWGVAGAATTASGVALLAISFKDSARLGKPADNVQLASFVGVCAFIAGIAAVVGGRALAAGQKARAAASFSVASGLCYGLATMATRQVGRTFSGSHPWHLFTNPTPYALAICSILGITLMQRGLQTGPALTFPITSALSASVPVIIGAAVLHDEVPTGWLRASFLAALVLMATGVVVIGRDRSAAYRAAEV